MKKLVFLIVGIAISGFCLYLVFRGLALKDIGQALHQADFRWIGIASIVYGLGFVTRTLRWQGLMQSIRKIPASDLLNPMVLGFFANNILPFRMGELVRAHVTGKKFGISRTASLATIILERLFDTISFLTIFLIVTLVLPFPSAVKYAAGLMAMGCAVLCISLFLATTHQQKALGQITHLPLPQTWKDRMSYLLTNFTHGVSGLTRPSFIIKAVCFSMAVWTIEGTTLYCIAHAFPIHLTYPQAYFVLFFLGLSVTLPQAPGYIGAMEAAGVGALWLLGIPREQGLPVILAAHGFQFLFIGTLGCIALWREGISLGSLITSAPSESETV
jgi:uncharacterized protein (TIRG00374 family)